jgi:hypothetical protein
MLSYTGHTSRGKAQASERERREYRGVEFGQPSGWPLVTVVLGVPWTTYSARRHTPLATWSMPLFGETNVVMTLAWTLLFLAAAGIVARTPLWVQPIVGASL